MVDLAALKAKNLQRWQACFCVADLIPVLDRTASKLLTYKGRYVTVENKTGVPWAVVAVIHERESSQSWAASLAQGDPWNKPSIHVPAHRGPFSSWEEAAEDALVVCPPHAAHWEDWSIAGALTLLEQYNGTGYAAGPYDHATGRQYPPQASPYVWASTNQYIRGKYVADGHFDPNAVDHQLGCAALLLRMIVQDPSISGGWHP